MAGAAGKCLPQRALEIVCKDTSSEASGMYVGLVQADLERSLVRRKGCSWLPRVQFPSKPVWDKQTHQVCVPLGKYIFFPTITLRFRQFCKLVGETQERLSPQARVAQSPLSPECTDRPEGSKVIIWTAGSISSKYLNASRTKLGSVDVTDRHSHCWQHQIWWQAVSRPTPASSHALLGPRVYMVIFLGPS